jgi:hypothetical protein
VLGGAPAKKVSGMRPGPRQRQISSTYQPRTPSRTTITQPNFIARSEIDNHADRTCFGANFTAVQFTGKHCEVSPFSDHYNKMMDVPIASAATAWDDPETGKTTILIFHQGLWFGNQLPNSLINPNQCRMHGIELCKDPFDPHRALGITDAQTEFHIPLVFGQSFVYFQTRAPTLEEIQDLPHIEMTSELPWDPASIGLRPLTREEEEKKKLISSVKIDAITIKRRPEEP